jgi:phage terminase small subunit
MTPAATTVLRRVMREMGSTGLITSADADALRAYCESVARYQYAARMRSSRVRWCAGRRASSSRTRSTRSSVTTRSSCARELGLTPAARTGLHGNQQEERDPFADFLDGTNG